jgi:hypothetical protein
VAASVGFSSSGAFSRVDPIALNGRDLHFEIRNGANTYDGKLNAQETAIEGDWKQFGASAPLVLKRVKK